MVRKAITKIVKVKPKAKPIVKVAPKPAPKPKKNQRWIASRNIKARILAGWKTVEGGSSIGDAFGAEIRNYDLVLMEK